MKKNNLKSQLGITLVELTVAIVIIAVISTVVFVSLNAGKRTAQAQDMTRRSDVASILSAVRNYMLDNKGQAPDCGGFDLPADGIYRWVGSSGAGGSSYVSGANSAQGAWLMNQASPIKDEVGTNNGIIQENGGDFVSWSSFSSSSTLGYFSFSASVGDGNYGYVSFTVGDSYNYQKITLASWIYLTDPSPFSYDRTIVGKVTVSSDIGLYKIYQEKLSTNIKALVKTSSGGYKYCSVANSLPLNKWYHIAMTYDNSIGYKTYLNGSLVSSVCPQTSGDIPNDLTNDSFYIAGHRASGSYSRYDFNGKIDDVAVFNKALTADQIKQIYRYGLTGTWLNCDLNADLVTTKSYLTELPQDPAATENLLVVGNSGYMIKKDASGTVSVKAPYTSQYSDKEIEISY